MPKKQYSDRQKAESLAALDANGGNVAKTARQLKISRGTLRHWSEGGVNPDVADLRGEVGVALADRLEELAHKLLDHALEKAGTAPLQATMIALAIAIDKKNLLQNRPTSITGHSLTDDERVSRIDAILTAARARRAEQLPDKSVATVIRAGDYPTVSEALDARDLALDAGHAPVRVDGLPEVVEGFCHIQEDEPVEVL